MTQPQATQLANDTIGSCASLLQQQIAKLAESLNSGGAWDRQITAVEGHLAQLKAQRVLRQLQVTLDECLHDSV